MTVYEPAEDSFLLKNYVSELDLEGKKTLDIGTGSGIIALEMAESGARVTAVDINPAAVEETRRRADEEGFEIDVIESGLFENVEESFDLITFNPPYLPGEEGAGDEEIWRGGETGIELTEKFLDQVDDYLEEEGFALVIVSDRADHERLIDRYGLEVVERRSLWFETLLLARYE
ncbi:MAG: release factor glutamine methyltransferase [Candidatus Nanohaloarchaea archaeon]|jgi:release factor glutamine methyltransferase